MTARRLRCLDYLMIRGILMISSRRVAIAINNGQADEPADNLHFAVR